MIDQALAEIVRRRFGPGLRKPCVRPDIVVFAAWECQKRDRCQYARPALLALNAKDDADAD